MKNVYYFKIVLRTYIFTLLWEKYSIQNTIYYYKINICLKDSLSIEKKKRTHIKIAGFQAKLNKIFSTWQAAYI